MSLPFVTLTGQAYDQGFTHGRELRAAIHHNLAVYMDRFYREGGVTTGEVLRRAARYAEAIALANPDYYEGMRGIAAGAEISTEEVTALNVRYEILYYQYTVRQMDLARDGCTAFALAPNRATNGHLWLGQNWDWIPEVKGAILHTTHPTGRQTLAFTEAGIFGGKIGLNDAGLGLVINGLSTTSDDWQSLKKPFHVRCYELLLQEDLQQAQAVIADEARACSANYLMASVSDGALDVEAAPDSMNVLPLQEAYLVHANHFVDPERTGIEEPPDEMRRFSRLRQERLEGFLHSGDRFGLSELSRFLQDHENAPRSMCRHEDRSAPVDEQYRTVTSIVMDLNECILWATDGPPCENPYVSFSLTPNRNSEDVGTG